ncbi:hypothetical protein [Streptomyces sp. NPDC002644]
MPTQVEHGQTATISGNAITTTAGACLHSTVGGARPSRPVAR